MKKVLFILAIVTQISSAKPYVVYDKYDEVLATLEQPFKKNGIISGYVTLGVDNNGNGYIEVERGDYISDFKFKGGDTVYITPKSFYYRGHKYQLDMRTFFTLSEHDKELLNNNTEIVLLATRIRTFIGSDYLDKINLKKEGN